MISASLTGQIYIYRLAEKSTAGAALVFHHAVAVVFAQNQQLNRVGWTHHFVFQYGTLAAIQLSINTLCCHALSVCQGEDLSTLWRFHATATQWKFLSLLDS